jgi:outer membrane murein-binding lipoprotein Lpp
MNLYQINEEIEKCIDTETGEILDLEALDKLAMERDTKIENLACWYKNLMADAEALKAEKNAFAKRENAAKNKADSIKRYLSSVLDGEKFATSD